MSLTAGSRLGPYQIVGSLGAGGMGDVYRARDTRLDRTVAVKVIHANVANDPLFRDRFEREARAASVLSHPNILSVFDVGREGAADYLVTELIDGVTLRDRLEGGPLPPREVVHIGAQLADGLAAAHAAGLVHRDLKPENVMVTRDGRAKILDFGLAKPLDEGVPGQHTQTAISEAGLLVGTIGYIAPEQVSGLAATAQSDLFALGVVLHEMASGQRVFARATAVETLNAILKEDPPPLPASLPAGLQQIIGHCLEKEPVRRFQTAADVAFALRSFATTTTVQLPALAAPARRRLLLYALAGTAAAALLAAAGFLAVRLRVPPSIDAAALELLPLAVESPAEKNGSLSPDGHSVAYLREVTAGSSELVVKGDTAASPVALAKAGGYLPFWSRDGQRIYFLQGTGLRSIASVGGEVRRELPETSGADLAPDGSTFAILKLADPNVEKTPTRLFVGPLDRLQPYQPAFEVAIRCYPNVVRFSPDGTKLLVWLTCGPNSLAILPVPNAQGQGGPPRRVFEGRVEALALGADWLSDSRHVVLSTRGSLWLGDTESGALTRLTHGTTRNVFPDVGRDNTVVFTEDVEDYDVVALPIAGGAPQPLVNSSRYDGSAAWMPRGSTLAYVVDRGEGDEVWTRTGEAAAQRVLRRRDFPEPAPEGVRGLTVSADGRWLSFLAYSSRPSFTAGIWVAPVGGGTPRPITPKSVFPIRSSWSPDGRALAIEVGESRPDQLWIYGVGDSTARRLNVPGEPSQTEWSPTGEWSAAMDFSAKGETLLVNPKDGTLRKLPPLGSPALTWSQDGKTIYGVAPTTAGDRSELRALDVASGTMRTLATYATRLRLEENIGGSLRMTLAPDGRTLVTTLLSDRSNVWMLKGLQPPRKTWW
jgi:Tol biopolymer transport system component